MVLNGRACCCMIDDILSLGALPGYFAIPETWVSAPVFPAKAGHPENRRVARACVIDLPLSGPVSRGIKPQIIAARNRCLPFPYN